MLTIYYTTEHFIQHQGNLVDLAAYRQKLSAVSGGDLAPVLAEPVADPEPEVERPQLYLLPKPAPMTHRRRSARRQRRLRRAAVVLDLCASIAVVALTAGALVAFLGLLG